MIMAEVANCPRDCIHSASPSDIHSPGNIILPRALPPSIIQGLLFPSRSNYYTLKDKKRKNTELVSNRQAKIFQQLVPALSKKTNWHPAITST